MDQNQMWLQSNSSSGANNVVHDTQNIYNTGSATMDFQENGGAGLATASAMMISPANDQNNYAAIGISNNNNESLQNSSAFQGSFHDQTESLPEYQNSMTPHSSTHPGQLEYIRSENDLPEGDRAPVLGDIADGIEERAVLENTATLLDQPKTEENVAEQDKAKTDEKPPEATTKKRVSDIARVQKVLEELSAKHSGPDQGSGARHKRQKISNDARSLILEYAKELSSAILEESCLLAKHRNSKELITADIKLIFAKKFRLDISGYQPRSTRLTQQAAEREEDEEEEEGNVKGDEETPIDKVPDGAVEAVSSLEPESTQESTAAAGDAAVAHSEDFPLRHDEGEDSRSLEGTSHGMSLAQDYPRDDLQ